MDLVWFNVTIVDIGVFSFSFLGLFLLYRRCNTLQKENEELRKENEELRLQQREFQSAADRQLKAMQAENEKLREENEGLRLQYREFQSATDRRLNAMQAENDELRRENEMLRQDLLKKGEAIAKLREEVADVFGRYVEIKAFTERLFPMLNKIVDLLSKQQ